MQKIKQTTQEKELTKTRIRTLQINTKGHKETLTLENTEAAQKTQENTQQQQEEQKTTNRKHKLQARSKTFWGRIGMVKKYQGEQTGNANWQDAQRHQKITQP